MEHQIATGENFNFFMICLESSPSDEVGVMDNPIQVKTVYWDAFPAYQDRLAILEQIKMGEYIEDLPFSIPANALTWRIPVPHMACLEFIKIKCYKDSTRRIPFFVWQRAY